MISSHDRITPPGSFWRDVWADLLTNSLEPKPLGRQLLSLLLAAVASSGFHALLLHRISYRFARWRLVPFAVLVEKVIYHWYHCSIPAQCEIGPGIWLPHPLVIVIAKTSRIGSGVKLFQSVQIISTASRPDGSGLPEIADLVWLSPACIVIGTKIGVGTQVAAGSVVTKHVGSCQLALGMPASARPLTESQKRHQWDWRQRHERFCKKLCRRRGGK